MPTHDEDTLGELLSVLREFSDDRVAPLSEVPEEPKDQAAFDAVLQQLGQLGLLPEGDEPGVLWAEADDASAALFSARAIAALSAASSTLGLHAHLGALAGALAPIGITAQTLALSLDPGAVGAARATGRAFANTVSAGDEPFLADLWGAPTAGHPRMVIGSGEWEHVLWPCWDAQGWTWRLSTREEAVVIARPHQHGFSEMVFEQWYLDPTRAADAPVVETAISIPDAIALHGLGLIAVAHGSLKRALKQAREHSQLRFQGGKIIAEHDAVSRLLSDGEQALTLTDATLPALCAGSGLDRLLRVWRGRITLHPLLCTGGTNALQSFGGIGYMRDLGVEKEVRAMNTLRRLGGSPSELSLRCAGIEESRWDKSA